MTTFTDDERAYLTEMRAITTDMQGREIFVGLTPEETDFYIGYSRDLHSNNRSNADSARYLELNDKHEVARHAVLAAENQRRVDNPPLH
ncbi:MAG: hypothetical protein ACYCZD_01395 [Rhodanobacter sp.]